MPGWYRFLEPAPRLAAIFIVAASFTLGVSPAFAGVELQSTTTDHSAKPPRVEHTTTLASEGNLRIDVTPNSGEAAAASNSAQAHSTIFRGAFDDFLVVDHAGKTFSVMDEQAIEDLKAQLQFTMLQIDRRMAELPVEQRKRMRDSLKPPPEVESRIVETDKTEMKSGLECRLYEVLEGEVLKRHVWVASWDQIEGGAQLQKALLGFDTFTSNLSDAFKEVRSEALGGAQIFDLGGSNPFDDFKNLGGLPVHTVEFENGKPSFETVIGAVVEKALTPRDFLPPASYKRRSWTGE